MEPCTGLKHHDSYQTQREPTIYTLSVWVAPSQTRLGIPATHCHFQRSTFGI